MFLWACNRRCCHMGFYHSQSHLYDIRSFFLSLPIFFLISISFYTILYTLWFKSWISWHLKNELKVLSTLFETYFLYTNKENPIQLYLKPTSNRESDFLLFITIRKWSGRKCWKKEKTLQGIDVFCCSIVEIVLGRNRAFLGLLNMRSHN